MDFIDNLIVNHSLTEIAIWSFVALLVLYLILRFLITRISDVPKKGFLGKKICDDAKLLNRLINLSADMLLIVDSKKNIRYANETILKFAPPIKADSSIRVTDNIMRFRVKGDIAWVSLSDLLDMHIERDSGQKSIFPETEMKSEISMEVLIEILTYKSPDNHNRRYYAISIHDMECKKKLFNIHHLNAISGLPNQHKAFSDIMAATSSSGDGSIKSFAILSIEMDEFSMIRSLLGYTEMNEIILSIASLLREVYEQDRFSVYHMSYVNFLILAKDVRTIDAIYGIADMFHSALKQLNPKNENVKNLTFSIGASLFPDHGTLGGLINSSYHALYEAQKLGIGHTVIAKKEFTQKTDHEIKLNNEIQAGLKNKEFKLYFQPIYESMSRKIAGAEVLLRWHHPTRGLVMPDAFVPIAERSGLIVEMGTYVLNESLKKLESWKSYGFKPLQLSINLSLRELENEDFINNLANKLYASDIGDSKIKIEITEHASMANPELTRQKLNEIKQLGIDISLDDFGTGYSSFAYLAKFPIDTLKIDKSFVMSMFSDESSMHIVSTIAKLAHSLNMSVVAEGIEREEELSLLQSYGVEYLQGYYFSKPLPLLEFQYLLTHSDIS